MTEKRFELGKSENQDTIFDNESPDDYYHLGNDTEDVKALCNLLNELNEKNKLNELHEENKQLKNRIKENSKVLIELSDKNERLKGLNHRLKEGILWLLEILHKKAPEEDMEFLCQIFFDCDYETAKEKYGTLLEIMSLE